ncbi:Uncharacterized protein PBTT_09825 [Plasmodiophora brassicae]
MGDAQGTLGCLPPGPSKTDDNYQRNASHPLPSSFRRRWIVKNARKPMPICRPEEPNPNVGLSIDVVPSNESPSLDESP